MPHRNVANPSPSPTRQPLSSPHASTDGSPARPSELEVLYNAAVEAFVRRDHLKTQSTLSRLLQQQLKSQAKRETKAWYDLSPANARTKGHNHGPSSPSKRDEWTTKTLKLLITSHASLYTDPPASNSSLPPELTALLPPSPPDKLLEHVRQTCAQHVEPILPPQLVSTFILASLKLRPAEPALSWTHHLTEDWLAKLPDSFMEAISARTVKDPIQRKQVEGLREAYLKVIELFVGELLARQGEWEMARGLLEGESIMPSKRKEELYKHLRNMQARKSNPSSPATSGILPSPSASSSGIFPDPTSPSPSRTKGRSLSTSSSSSERTARPVNGGLPSTSRSATLLDRKGKGRAASTTGSTESVPRHIEVNHTPAKTSPSSLERISGSVQDRLRGILEILPPALRNRLHSSSFLRLLGVSAGIPLILMALMLLVLRRSRRRSGSEGVAIGAMAAGGGGMADVRARLALARQRGLFQWLRYWLGWWVEKFAGVWQLGTSITYF